MVDCIYSSFICIKFCTWYFRKPIYLIWFFLKMRLNVSFQNRKLYSMTFLLVQHHQQQQKQPNCNKDNKFSRIFCARKYHPWSVLWRVIDCSSFVPGPSTSVRGVIKSPGQNSNSGFVGNQALFVLIMSITPSICGTCNRIYEEKKMYGFFQLP